MLDEKAGFFMQPTVARHCAPTRVRRLFREFRGAWLSGRAGHLPSMPLNVLFLCSRNRLRSPTAGRIFSGRPGIEVASAGLSNDADEECTAEIVEWADLIFVMENAHRRKLSSRFGRSLRKARVICLDIPEKFEFMDPALVALFLAKVPQHLP